MLRPLAQCLSRNSNFAFRDLLQRNTLRCFTTTYMQSSDASDGERDQYTYGGKFMEFLIPADKTSVVVGKRGRMIRTLQTVTQSNISIDTARNSPHPHDRRVKIVADDEHSLDEAKGLIDFLVDSADLRKMPDKSSWCVPREGETTERLLIEDHHVGTVFGKFFFTKDAIEVMSQCRMKIDRSDGGGAAVTIAGTTPNIKKAREMIHFKIKRDESYQTSPRDPLEGEAVMEMTLRKDQAAIVTGRDGFTKTVVELLTECRLQLVEESKDEQVAVKPLLIMGEEDKIHKAKDMIESILRRSAWEGEQRLAFENRRI